MADPEQPEPELRSGAQAETAESEPITLLVERPKNVEMDSKIETTEEPVKDVKGKSPEDVEPDTPEPEEKVEETQPENLTLSKAIKMEFLTLPYDLKSLILSYITRPTDMKNLCLVNKEIRDISIRQLYRRVDLDIGGATDSRLSAFLGRDNPGLPHIREVNLWLYEDEDGATLQQANFTMRLLIDLLPPNTLEAFNWHEYGKFSSENFLLLCKRQKRLKYLQANPMDKSVMDVLRRQPSIITNLSEADDLGLFPTNEEELEICHLMVKHAAPQLKELMLCPAFHRQERETLGLNDGATEPGLLTKTIFRHMLPFKTCTALRLKTLWLENVNLRYAVKTYMKVIDFPSLEFLDIRSCVGADGLLQGMTKAVAGRGSKLTELRLNHHEDDEQDAIVALEGFLNSFNGLETLFVVLYGASDLPKVDCITRHKNTLAELLVEARGNVVHEYSHLDVKKIITDCKKLQQLAIAFPEYSCMNDPRGHAIEPFIAEIQQSQSLVTLNITNWPTAHAGTPPLSFSIFEHLVQRIAQIILCPPPNHVDDDDSDLGSSPPAKPTSKLSVVSFGTSEKNKRVNGVYEDLRQMIFWKGSMRGAFGAEDEAPLAMAMKWRPLKYAEPFSDVLEYRHC